VNDRRDQPASASGASTPPRPADDRSPHSWRNRLGRALWGLVWLVLFRPSPRLCHAWRRWLLRLFGARLGRGAKVYSSARVWAPWNLRMGDHAMIAERVDVYCVGTITLGDRANVSQYTFLCGATHDYTDAALPLVHRPITIGADAWVAADVFVAPGVTIGEGCVVGARSAVFGDLPAWTVCVGSPARPVKPRRMTR
jgi:putative colanic acid biosynthesis acetyltransferase WcaF